MHLKDQIVERTKFGEKLVKEQKRKKTKKHSARRGESVLFN